VSTRRVGSITNPLDLGSRNAGNGTTVRSLFLNAARIVLAIERHNFIDGSAKTDKSRDD
jgi:hypothetical protein